MLRFDVLDSIFEPTAPMSVEQAARYITRNEGTASFAVLYNTDGEAVIFPRMRSWCQPEIDDLCNRYEYNEAAWINIDGTRGESRLTGSGLRLPSHRRQLTLVA